MKLGSDAHHCYVIAYYLQLLIIKFDLKIYIHVLNHQENNYIMLLQVSEQQSENSALIMQQYLDLLYHTKEVECWLTPAKHQFISVSILIAIVLGMSNNDMI